MRRFDIWMIAVLTLALLSCIFFAYREERSVVGGMSLEERKAFYSFTRELECLEQGEFVVMDNNDTYIVIESPNRNYGEIWLKGPGPELIRAGDKITVLRSLGIRKAYQSFLKVDHFIKKDDPSWQAAAALFFMLDLRKGAENAQH